MEESVYRILAVAGDWLVWLLNSNFLAALAGAFAGAVAADRIATRKTKQNELSNAVRDTNSAITLAGMIANTALALKGQHVLETHEDFVHEEVRFHEVQRRDQAGLPVAEGEFVLKADLAELPELLVPIDGLSGLVFKDLKLDGRPVGLMLALQNAVNDLNLTVRKRNQLCDQFRAVPNAARLPLYLGLPMPGGRDETFPHSVFHIYQLTNNVAFFAAKLCSDLTEHGERVGKRYAKAFRSRPAYINRVSFDTPAARRLMPPEASYTSFLSMFRQVERKPPPAAWKRWWRCAKRWTCRQAVRTRRRFRRAVGALRVLLERWKNS
jgi:hypothetical protein